MPSREKQHSKSSARDPLDTPYITDKLQKLQGVHAATEALMDRLHNESLNAEGKQRERVRTKARKPGPRTEVEKRKFYRAKRLRPKAMPQPEFFTLEQAAVKLGYETRKSVKRLINSGELEAEYRVHAGKRRLMINRVNLNRYVIFADRWFQTQFGPVPTLQGQGEFGVVFVYGPWKKEASARLPRYTLTVTIEEFWQFACKSYESQSDYESIKTALRKRVRGASEDFQVRYVFDHRALASLKRIIGFTWKERPYYLEGLSRRDLFAEALSHLQLKALPNLRRAEDHWVAYFCQIVRNFFKDKWRQDNRLFPHINASVDVDRLTEIDNISDPLDYSKAQRANARAGKGKKPDEASD